jgi:hypothetical protein
MTPDEVAAMQPAIDSLDNELPVRIEVANARIDLQDGHGQAQTQRAGQVRQRLAPDGRPQWQLNASEDHLMVQCTEYHQWRSEWQRARRYLQIMCTPLAEAAPGMGVVALVHSALDRFVFNGDPDSYDHRVLFQEDCRYLTPQIVDSGAIWHIHQGWLESMEIPIRGRLLQLVNLGSVVESGRAVTSIDHGIHYQFANPEPLSVFFGPAAHRVPDTFFEDAHRRNKDLLISTLQDDALEQIGLTAVAA